MSYEPRIAIHPGEVLCDILETKGYSQNWLAERTGYSDKQISQIINGKAIITPELAMRLERVLDSSADFWNNLTIHYQADLARIDEQRRAREESIQYADEVKNAYNELVSHGYFQRERDSVVRIKQLWNFFGVNSIADIATTQPVAFRKSPQPKQDKYIVAAWLRCGEVEAGHLSITNPFDKTAVENAIAQIKAMIPCPPCDFFVKIQNLLKEAGVALVTVGYFKNSHINGATRWDGQIPIIQLSDRGKCDDKIWFTLFHELGHVILHSKRAQFITGEKQITSRVEESEADEFASNTLIDPIAYSNFIQSKYPIITQEQIIAFAKEQGTAPSIVLGRLQHDRYVAYSQYNKLHRKLTAV